MFTCLLLGVTASRRHALPRFYPLHWPGVSDPFPTLAISSPRVPSSFQLPTPELLGKTVICSTPVRVRPTESLPNLGAVSDGGRRCVRVRVLSDGPHCTYGVVGPRMLALAPVQGADGAGAGPGQRTDPE
ncbi:hypothetical protein GY45DRAFT_581210 [Cubamyces sp. BRFM 1775]|nr:hypothetical protein GY45DRAFT_581210 [Cubamyces sp. BRFM 1775]